jgi:transposase-like protein
MLVELRVAEQQLRAVWEVLDGASVTEVARRFQVSRQSVHVWLRRYAADQGLGDRSSRPHESRSVNHLPERLSSRYRNCVLKL